MHNRPRSLPFVVRQRWNSLTQFTSAQVKDIVHDFMEQLGSTPYKTDSVALRRIESDAYQIFHILIKALQTDGDLPHEVTQAAQMLGEERAAIGATLAELRTAIQSDFYVLWDHISSQINPEDYSITIEAAPFLLRTIEEFISNVEVGYERTNGRNPARRHVREQHLVPLLLNGSQLGVSQLQTIASAMNSAINDQYFVCGSSLDQRALDSCATEFSTRGRPSLVHSTGTHILLVVPASPTNFEIIAQVTDLQCGVSEPVTGLKEVARAARLAVDIDDSRQVGDPKILRYQDVWQRLAVKPLLDTAPEFFELISKRLASGGNEEFETLRTTIVASVEHSTIGEAAEKLFCHRNTVQNRLSRVSHLTGFDIRVPKWLLLLYIAALGSEPR